MEEEIGKYEKKKDGVLFGHVLQLPELCNF
jgi:hypothetical protein